MADSSKDTIMKMLLSTPNPSQAEIQQALNVMDKTDSYKEVDGSSSKLSNYLQQLNGQEEKIHSIELDHSYSKPWNWRPDNTYAQPAKTLFVSKAVNNLKSRKLEEEIDVEVENETPKPAYDEVKARQLMNETEKHISLLRSEEGSKEWETLVNRNDWTMVQNRIFDRAARILNQDRLARLTIQGSWNEPVLRRVAVNKSARRMRTLFAAFSWQTKLLNWLHNLLLDILDTSSLTAYIDILQALKKKIPHLIDRILALSSSSTKINADALNLLLKKPWDPSSAGLACHSPKRLPGNPLIVIVPGGAGGSNLTNPKIQRWHNHLSMIGTVFLVATNNLNSTKSTVLNSLDHMMASTRAKIAELKADHIGKNIILVGINTGAALACQVALLEPVMAVICLGFPLNTVDEKRGQPDDNILNLNVPVLFIIGQHAATSNVEDIEELRERLRVENGLVIVGAADDCLRINKSKQSAEGITQSMLDRCIVDEVADFIGTILLTPTNRPDVSRARIKVVEKKRKISINDEILSRKHITPISTYQRSALSTVTSIKRAKAPPRAVSRPKWNPQGSSDTLTTIAKKTGISKETLLAATKPNPDAILVNNGGFEKLKLDGRTEQQFKILPQFKFLSSDDFNISNADSSFVDQLTPDRLLEMPVIIQDDSSESPAKVVISSGSETNQQAASVRCLPSGQSSSSSSSSSSQVKCATLFFRNKDGIRSKGGLTNEERAILMKDTWPRIRNLPTTKNANTNKNN